jgi:ABC-2 type transport system ATP-binding protein
MSLPIESEHQVSLKENGQLGQAEIVHLENVSVRYNLPEERIGTFKEYAIRSLQRRIRYHSFWALDEVSLNVNRGEVFGVIGKNGAGKSTLLKVISRVLRPTKGRIIVYGKVAPLLELGAGFHPELSGRENIYLNGALLGYSQKEMEACFDQIVEFSELRQFIDASIRTYSSGMYARLGFAVATAHVPDILLVDEILSVGDGEFQQKCYARINEFRSLGSTIVMVSHNMDLIGRICQRACCISHGKIVSVGEPNIVISDYSKITSN